MGSVASSFDAILNAVQANSVPPPGSSTSRHQGLPPQPAAGGFPYPGELDRRLTKLWLPRKRHRCLVAAAPARVAVLRLLCVLLYNLTFANGHFTLTTAAAAAWRRRRQQQQHQARR